MSVLLLFYFRTDATAAMSEEMFIAFQVKPGGCRDDSS